MLQAHILVILPLKEEVLVSHSLRRSGPGERSVEGSLGVAATHSTQTTQPARHQEVGLLGKNNTNQSPRAAGCRHSRKLTWDAEAFSGSGSPTAEFSNR